jgi:hypothetical protein
MGLRQGKMGTRSSLIQGKSEQMHTDKKYGALCEGNKEFCLAEVEMCNGIS